MTDPKEQSSRPASQPAPEDQFLLAVIVTEFGAAANVGGNPETTVRMFELPKEIADYIRANRGQWSSVQLAFEDSK